MTGWTRATWISIFVLNLAMLLAALALIAVGFWMRYDGTFDSRLKSVIYGRTTAADEAKSLADAKFDVRVWLIVVFWSIVGLALGAVVTSIVGMLSTFIRRSGVTVTFLVLLVTLIVLEFGSAIALLLYRSQLRDTIGTLVSAMYTSNARDDLKVIQDMYACCGIRDGSLNGFYCPTPSDKPTCDVAVFDSVDNTMMISGIVFLVVLILQLVDAILPVPLMIRSSRSSKHRFVSTHIERF